MAKTLRSKSFYGLLHRQRFSKNADGNEGTVLNHDYVDMRRCPANRAADNAPPETAVALGKSAAKPLHSAPKSAAIETSRTTMLAGRL